MSDGAPAKVEMILQANPDSMRHWSLIPLRNTTIRCTSRKTQLFRRAANSPYERALTTRLECLVGPLGTYPLPIIVDLIDDWRRRASITRERNWIARSAGSHRLPM
jgi:hypothetical protein